MLQQKNKPAVMNALRDARLARGLTEPQLATMAGCEPATIVAIEDGEYTPSVSLSLRLAWALAYPVEQLFWLSPSKSQVPQGRGDERSQRIFSESYLSVFGVILCTYIIYDYARLLFSLPKVTRPQDAIIALFLLTSFAAQFYAFERRAKKPFDKLGPLRRIFYGGGIFFYLVILGDDIGLTTAEIDHRACDHCCRTDLGTRAPGIGAESPSGAVSRKLRRWMSVGRDSTRTSSCGRWGDSRRA